MLEAALKQEPGDVGYRDGLYRTRGVAAMFLRQIGKRREAAENWEQVVELAGSAEKPLRLVEATEFWIDAKDFPRATEAARRASTELPKDAPVALWQRHATVLGRLARLVESDETIPKDDRSKIAAELRTAANTARDRAGIGPIESMLHNAFDFFKSPTSE